MKGLDYHKDPQAEGWVSASPLPTPDELQVCYSTVYYQIPWSIQYSLGARATFIRPVVGISAVRIQGAALCASSGAM